MQSRCSGVNRGKGSGCVKAAASNASEWIEAAARNAGRASSCASGACVQVAFLRIRKRGQACAAAGAGQPTMKCRVGKKACLTTEAAKPQQKGPAAE
eukprot:1078064-Pelagomonas_calceolata.AAC.2